MIDQELVDKLSILICTRTPRPKTEVCTAECPFYNDCQAMANVRTLLKSEILQTALHGRSTRRIDIETISKEELDRTSLPKYPQCFIYGDAITRDQATEIIRRTDIGMSIDSLEVKDEELEHRFSLFGVHGEEDMRKFLEEVNYLQLPMLHNHWLDKPYYGGCYGWCHQNGIISYARSIGKWPKCSEVADELLQIAKAFPFLHMYVSLLEWEFFEHRNIISFEVCNGKVYLIDKIPLAEIEEAHKERKELLPDELKESVSPELFLTRWSLEYLQTKKK